MKNYNLFCEKYNKINIRDYNINYERRSGDFKDDVLYKIITDVEYDKISNIDIFGGDFNYVIITFNYNFNNKNLDLFFIYVPYADSYYFGEYYDKKDNILSHFNSCSYIITDSYFYGFYTELLYIMIERSNYKIFNKKYRNDKYPKIFPDVIRNDYPDLLKSAEFDLLDED